MGLDMYLNVDFYISKFDESEKGDLRQHVRKVLGVPDDDTIQVKCRFGYWRKANAVHKWFVDHCQNGVDDCRDATVGREQLVELRDACRQVLEDPKLAPKLLPTQGGFFFGPTEYDEYYFEDLKETVEIIDAALKIENGYFEYHSSW